MNKAQVIIYSRPGCHLCDEAKQIIRNSGCYELFDLEEVNIDGNLQLLGKYRFDIPVITINGEEAFRHRVDEEEFKRLVKGR